MIKERSKIVDKAIQTVEGFDVYQCPYCKKGHMQTIEVLPRIRSPVNFSHPKQRTTKV